MWGDFKPIVTSYIAKKVLRHEDAYERQRAYMMERRMPNGMDVNDWWLRMQTMDHHMPWFISSEDKLKKWIDGANWTDWWTKGGLSDTELKDIVLRQAPAPFILKLEQADVRRTLRDEGTTNELIDYFSNLQRIERNARPAMRNGGQRGGRGRAGPYQRGRVSPAAGRVGPYYTGRVGPYNQGFVQPGSFQQQ